MRYRFFHLCPRSFCLLCRPERVIGWHIQCKEQLGHPEHTATAGVMLQAILKMAVETKVGKTVISDEVGVLEELENGA